MTAERLAFDLAGAVAIVFAGVMVVHRNPIKSLLAVVVSFFALAGLFVILSAPFLAALEVIVYAGAILVLFLFVTMLLNPEEEAALSDPRKIQRYLGIAGIAAFAILLGTLIPAAAAAVAAPVAPRASGEVAPLAEALFSTAALPFEAVSVLLLSALVGAHLLLRRDTSPRGGA